MATNGLKSDTLHHYQKRCYPFWRRPENAGFYSEETKDYFERRKAEFEQSAKYIQWTVK